jgi:hypothetical protein
MAALVAAFVPAAEQAAAPFFNGKDLAGWEGLTEYWKVKDAELIGSTPEGLKFNTFLCSKKRYRDFELKFQVRLKDGTGNSGVQIRSCLRDGEDDRKHFAVEGPQCDIAIGYWGSLFGEHFYGKKPGDHQMMQAAPQEVVDRVLKKADFNDYFIRCVGKHVTLKLNGATTVDGDFPRMHDEGIIAWQIHSGPPMEVIFRNIQFKELK